MKSSFCARCYLNQFGTAENNSKACKRKHRIYILREGEIFPIILDLPTLSVDGFGRYLRRLLTVGKDPNAIVTRFALKKAINKAGITYSQVTFTEGRDLLPEELTAVRRLAAQVQAYSSSGDFDADDADAANADAIPDYDPETGEILSSYKNCGLRMGQAATCCHLYGETLQSPLGPPQGRLV